MSFRVKWVLMISFHTEPKWVPHLTYLKHTEKLYTRSEIRNCQLGGTTCIDIQPSTKVALSFKGLWVVDAHSLHQFRSWPFLKRGLTLMHFAAANKPCKPHRREKPKKKRSRQHSIFLFWPFFMLACSNPPLLSFWAAFCPHHAAEERRRSCRWIWKGLVFCLSPDKQPGKAVAG